MGFSQWRGRFICIGFRTDKSMIARSRRRHAAPLCVTPPPPHDPNGVQYSIVLERHPTRHAKLQGLLGICIISYQSHVVDMSGSKPHHAAPGANL